MEKLLFLSCLLYFAFLTFATFLQYYLFIVDKIRGYFTLKKGYFLRKKGSLSSLTLNQQIPENTSRLGKAYRKTYDK